MNETTECPASSEKVDIEQLFEEAQFLQEKLDSLFSQHYAWEQWRTGFNSLVKSISDYKVLSEAVKKSEPEQLKDD